MTNLTEQWVKQTLPLGWYYIKLQDGSIEIQQYIGGFLFDVNNVVVEVLAPVPSYEEYIAMKKLISSKISTRNNQDRLLAENIKLKEVLKECGVLFNRSTVDGEEPNNAELIMILTKIDEVLK